MRRPVAFDRLRSAGLLLLLTGSVSAGCGPDPDHEKTVAYLTELHPVLLENSLLAEQVLVQSASVYNQSAQPGDLERGWASDVLPMAQHVVVMAEEVQAPEHLAADHANLVAIWSKRATAYREVLEGLHTADADRFEAASRKTAEITVSEDAWVRAFNKRIQPMQLYVDLYP